ncbi:hypothetical protein ILYODFUR_017049, partial [Ilyodon furcidens]
PPPQQASQAPTTTSTHTWRAKHLVPSTVLYNYSLLKHTHVYKQTHTLLKICSQASFLHLPFPVNCLTILSLKQFQAIALEMFTLFSLLSFPHRMSEAKHHLQSKVGSYFQAAPMERQTAVSLLRSRTQSNAIYSQTSGISQQGKEAFQ